MKLSNESRTESYYLLTINEAQFFKALASLVVPSGKDPKAEPGALEVGAVNYIDSTLYAFPPPVQQYFRDAIEMVNTLSKKRFNGNFIDLADVDKNIVLRELLLNPRTRERAFDLRSLALEGFYSDYHDPWYHGTTAWELTKFGGKRVSDVKKDWSFLKVWKDWQERRSE